MRVECSSSSRPLNSTRIISSSSQTYVMKSTWLYFMMYQTDDDKKGAEEELGEMVIECLDFLFVIYQEDGNDVNNFFLDDVTKKAPGKLKQQKILLSLIEMVEALCQKVAP